MDYIIYTDGAYSIKNKEGAFAYVILNAENAEVERRAYKIKNETNNRAELKAVIAAVHRLPNDAEKVTIRSDSQYALNSLSGKWSYSENHDLFDVWINILGKRTGLEIIYEWVKGHSGDVYNELCDQMCNNVLGYNANKEFERFKKKKEQPKSKITPDLAWAVYNFINEYKAGKYGMITLQQALDLYFDY